MRFRPCIDIHNGKVKQIVGGSLCDRGDLAAENFISEKNAAWYAGLYAGHGLYGGHVIMLNAATSPFYEQTKEQALSALRAAPGTLQAGGGITPGNAEIFLDAGASHVIVTSYVFRGGHIDYEALEELVRAVGVEHLVLDLSARQRKDVPAENGQNAYYVVTDRWQTFTEERLDRQLLIRLGESCSEFLVHGVDVEGKQSGPDEMLAALLGRYAKDSGKPVTYAGGIRSMEDISLIRRGGHDCVDFTVGSALDLFGGTLPYRELVNLGAGFPDGCL